MKTAVIINQSTSYLTVDVCNAFMKSYDRVILLTGQVKEFCRKNDSRIEIIPICKYDRSSVIKRLKSWITGYFQIKKFLKNNSFKKDVLYFTNPPISYMLADKFTDRFAIVIYDLYPDVLRNIKCPKFFINRWAEKNNRIFNNASGLITLSEGMKLQISKYCKNKLINVIPNWSSSEIIEYVDDNVNPIIEKFNLGKKFVILYSGNIGYTHNVETIIEVANILKDDSKFAFLIIGDGGKKSALVDKSNQLGLKNVYFSDFLPADQLKYSLSCANIGVVTLTSETAQSSVPSKTYNLLAYGIPILNIAPKESELGNIIRENNCGSSYEASDIEGIKNFIIECQRNENLYGSLKNNATRTSSLFTYANAKQYLEVFK